MQSGRRRHTADLATSGFSLSSVCDGKKTLARVTMSERMLNEVMEELRAPGGPLESAPWAATHDLRRAFVTHMRPRATILGLGKDAVPMITRADEGREGLDETVYDQDPALPAKAMMLEEWDRLIKEGCARAEARLQRP